MADESLLTYDDAKTLADAPEWTWWNIRISKNGGFIPAWLLGAMAREKGVPFVLGCMVGESSILSAAQRRLLESGYAPRYVEGNYGRFLLADDLTKHSLRFGYGGRLQPLEGEGLGVEVDPAKLARYAQRVASL
jgi:muconate cycloisomerase